MIARMLCRLGLHKDGGAAVYVFVPGVPRERRKDLPPQFNAYALHDRWELVGRSCPRCGKRVEL